MIKTLKLSNKSVRRFVANKDWNYSTLSSEDALVLEQGDNIPIFIDSETQLSTEQNKSDFNLNLKYGKNIKEHFSKDSKYFNEADEPLNYDALIKESYISPQNIFSTMLMVYQLIRSLVITKIH